MSDKIECMRYAGRINREAIEIGFEMAQDGVTLAAVNDEIEKYILAHECKPAFKNYKPSWANTPFPCTACISPNDVAVHGIPGSYILKAGDILTIDVGTEYNGWYVDSAETKVLPHYILPYPTIMDHLLDATKGIFSSQLSVIKDGCTLLEIARVGERAAKTYGGVIILPQYTGHFIGDRIHMDPAIPNTIDRRQPIGNQLAEIKRLNEIKLKEGDTICIEPVVTFGNADLIIDDDLWTVRKADHQPVSHLEHCILVLKSGFEILS